MAEAPALYNRVAEVLRKSRPVNLGLWDDKSTWPQENESSEEQLQSSLLQLAEAPPDKAREAIFELEKVHAIRRQWVWAGLGQASLAIALKYLAIVAGTTTSNLGGDTPEAMATLYISEGWQADDAALSAMAEVSSGTDNQAVQAALRSCYLPWLEKNAQHLQQLIDQKPFADHGNAASILGGKGCVTVFTDGLRWDI